MMYYTSSPPPIHVNAGGTMARAAEGSGYRILITKLFRASKVEDNKLFNIE